MSIPRPRVDEFAKTPHTSDRRSLAQLLTAVESGSPDVVRATVERLHPRTGHARIIGVTGSPGVGKSTLTSAMVTELRRRGRTVAVIAVDPSSPLSRGAFLGDRVRMQSLATDPGVFIRSMASRGHLGGLSFATPLAVMVVDSAGFDDVIVETVGTGQSEIEISGMADTTVVAVAPGAGDVIQASKAGILEIADVFAANKADTPGAGRLHAELKGTIELGQRVAPPAGLTWRIPVVSTVAVRSEGISDLIDAITNHGHHLAESGQGTMRRRARALNTVRQHALEQVRHRFASLDDGSDLLLAELSDKVAKRVVDPLTAAERVLATFGELQP
jgi:LAO/AO transport system kinase